MSVIRAHRNQELLDLRGEMMKDWVTGIEGVVIAATFYLNDCCRLLLATGTVDKNDETNEYWIDSQQLFLSEKKSPFPRPEQKSEELKIVGGPGANAPSMTTKK